jgi:hypothetical protein
MTNRVSSTAAAVCVCVALAYLAGIAGGQEKLTPTPPPPTWPPRPADIVNVCLVGGKQEKMPDGQTGALVFTVPEGRACVVTDVLSDRGSLFIYSETEGTMTKKIYLMQGTAQSPAFSSRVGVVFPPKSKIWAFGPPAAINLTGYLTAP